MQIERGKINNRNRARQLRDFTGLQFGNITPTDIDGLIEYKNSSYVILEIKYRETKLPPGQKLALERMCDDFMDAGKKSIFIISTHEIDNPEDDILVAETKVKEYRFERKWHGGYKGTTKELITLFLNKCGGMDGEKIIPGYL
jgi:hypothetical protein